MARERGAVGRNLLSMVLVSALCGVLVAGLLLPVASLVGLTSRNVAEALQDLPLDLSEAEIPQRTTVLDRKGNPIAYFYTQNRQDVPLSEVSRTMRQAVIAIEDSRFYEHGALDVKGTLRALINNLAGERTQGGSSITQQLVKMTLLQLAETPEEREEAIAQTFERKFNELRYAMAYEQEHTKNEILRNYLNIAYFGDGAYGIGAAAEHYFSVKASELNVRQSALLAGLVKNPTQYDPTDNPKAARARRNVVLARMAEVGMIRDRLADKLAEKPLELDLTRISNGCVSATASFFCDYVRTYLLEEEFLGDTREERERVLHTAGLTIHTTLDRRMQKASDEAVRDHVFPTDNAIGGLALLKPGTGEVRALAQSRPMGDTKRQGQTYLNYLVPSRYGDSAGFQGGSTFKVFVLATALKKGYPTSTQFNSPASLVMPQGTYTNCEGGSPFRWTVQNSTEGGLVDMYTGTQRSVNTYYAQLQALAGLCPSVEMARSMGITVPAGEGGGRTDEVGPFTLGVTSVSPLEMAAAYATFPGRGVYCAPRPVTEILNQRGDTIVTVDEDCERLFRPAVADAVNDILRGVQEPGGFGYSNGLNLDIQSAAKTGTTQNNEAVWYMGYTPKLVTVAMIAGANSQGQPISLEGVSVAGNLIANDAAFGSTLAGPMWYDAMRVIQQHLPDSKFHSVDQSKLGGLAGTVPTVAGITVEDAANLLRAAGYVPQIQFSVDSEYPAGTVAYTTPDAGTELPEGSTVEIYPSSG